MNQQSQSDMQESTQLDEESTTNVAASFNISPRHSQSETDRRTPPPNQMQSPVEQSPNFGPCIICHVNESCILFLGCNHLACCGQCAATCGNICPVPNCRQQIRDYLPVFKP
ncbi:unnamed protein product [Rotaria magnacalcarata]|uniref:RING-type domain-containing protein n=2 Tax=Rotaria magnacalcarata TaxID=392030 RepID=A0A815WKY3_9BILA|nr:unnamed protein product [Rotaria magnacalcarata]CAF1639083.1 unnamed protein product [Rotaria magnacalcarata]CAF3903315.1 unnamed protein product [Rotaria magnacalcarata]CAF3908770.1 unnamed protein product [Rotaria magnacalcarata]CAF3930823.1 unnamed protein product [Rotaria magnacalcarata]